MNNAWLWFWTIVIFTSIAWYGFLVFFIGAKGGREIKTMIKGFEERDEQEQKNQGVKK